MTPGVRALVLSFALLAAAILAGCGRSEAQGGPPMAPPVSAAPAVSRDVTLYDEFSGRLEAVESVELRSRVAGTLQSVHFRDGQELQRGAPMFSIDARPFTAELARLEAQLASARNAAALADTEVARTRKLLEQKAVSQQEADQAEAAARNAAAAVKAAEAAVAAARLNVEYTQIRAPIAGRASRANVTAGNLVGVGDPVLTTLVAQDKVHAWFDVSEQAWLRVRGQFKGGAAPKVEMALADESALAAAKGGAEVPKRCGPMLDSTARAMVAGYQRMRLLTDAEWTALPEMLRLACVRFTTTRLTDVHLQPSGDLDGETSGESKESSHERHTRKSDGKVHSKDYRDYVYRIDQLQEISPEELIYGLR